MDRRNFFKKSLGVAAGTAIAAGGMNNIMAKTPEEYDLVAIKGGEPGAMFDKGIEALGGMKKFVKKGQKVVVKPNIGWDVTPERAANTNPELVARIITHCIQAGAEDVYVFDHTCDNWVKCYDNSGIRKAVEDAGGKMVPGNQESSYQEVEIPNGKRLRSTTVHELILQSDVFINVPVLKSHSSTRLTLAMKNLMGVVWDRGYWHSHDLHQCIADFTLFKKPDLNVIDAYQVMKKNGPRGVSVADVVQMKSQVISADIVAADAAAAKIAGLEPEDVSYIELAHEMKVGNKNLDQLSIKRITM